MKYLELFFVFIYLSANLLVSDVEARLKGEGIVGGNEAQDESIKYQVAILNYGQIHCGGSIIADQYIVTAAHCVIENDGSFFQAPLTVVAGITDINKIDKNAVVVEIDRIYVPREYKPQSGTKGDIAVLKLKQGLGLWRNRKLQRVKLPKWPYNYVNKRALVSGFGYNWVDVYYDANTRQMVEGEGGTYNKLRFAHASVITNQECERVNHHRVDPKQICARVVQRGYGDSEGVCSGDSGGPLVFNNELIGVVSSSPTGCRENEGAGVYTRVSSFLPFIHNAINDNQSSNMRMATWIESGDNYYETNKVLVEN